MPNFREQILKPYLRSVTQDVQVIQIAFPYVIQFIFREPRVVKKDVIMPILPASVQNAWRRKAIFFRGPRGKRLFLCLPFNLEFYLFLSQGCFIKFPVRILLAISLWFCISSCIYQKETGL